MTTDIVASDSALRTGTVRSHRVRENSVASAAAATEPDPVRLHTWTARSNEAMRTVDAAFGFERVEAMHQLERRPT